MKDISLPNYYQTKIVDRILEGKITFEQIQKTAQYEEMIKPRLEALVHLKNSLDNDFNLYSFMSRMYPFITNIKADYLITSHLVMDSYAFITHTTPKGDAYSKVQLCSVLFSCFDTLQTLKNPYFMRLKATTVSTFAVQGNWSTATAFSTLYPRARNTSRSRARLVGLQEIYRICSTP